ncbi:MULTISPECIES: YhgE/Pip domain-containing protein [Bacillus cereus group]|uniref:YhgE/Pip domain-containing protein n=1 Tax=Bacillus cereus group TaxID=86661 RepID=UPI00044A2924|nr:MULTISPECIES: ABC transporter permease [Bacillus cereus group]EXY05686.1 membrane protein [Bacillus thuringiensis]MEB8632521.1 ABC transporter permease [Bacillus cereus]MEB8745922.1 ABC transporter permease [Bacillus cereus]MEB8799291.1 ABC transporter permease [Bacillus cereus]MEB8809119.1 ABC transporter permease [Bacillus cereus]
MKFTQFLKTKGAIAAMIMGIFYAIAMLGIFLPGYTAIPGNVDKLPIAIVNSDTGQYGAKISSQLKENLPFKEIKTDLNNKQALKSLEENDIALVVHIPETFSADMQKGKASSSIDFTINEAGATTVSSTMKSVVKEINDQLSAQFSQQTAESVLMKFNVPKEQAAELAKRIETTYTGNVVTINKIPDGMNNQSLPMFLTMAGYVGAMIAGMQLVSAFRMSRGKASKTRLFIYVQLTALMIAVVSSLAATGITYLVNEPSGNLFFSILGQQILNYVVCFNFTAILVFLVGEGGMILNLPILLTQTLANGAIMSRDMMPLPYEWMSHISPMYYSVQAYFANLYGSISPSPYIWSMVAVGAGAILINILIVAFLHKSMPVDASESNTETASVKKAAEVTV